MSRSLARGNSFVVRDSVTGQLQQVTVEPIPEVGTIPSMEWNRSVKEKSLAGREFRGTGSHISNARSTIGKVSPGGSLKVDIKSTLVYGILSLFLFPITGVVALIFAIIGKMKASKIEDMDDVGEIKNAITSIKKYNAWSRTWSLISMTGFSLTVFGIIVWIIMIKTDEPVCYNCEVSTETPETPN